MGVSRWLIGNEPGFDPRQALANAFVVSRDAIRKQVRAARLCSIDFPAVRAVNDVLTWAFTLRACPRREGGRDAPRRMRRSVADLSGLGRAR
jgi:hypothetical protein